MFLTMMNEFKHEIFQFISVHSFIFRRISSLCFFFQMMNWLEVISDGPWHEGFRVDSELDTTVEKVRGL